MEITAFPKSIQSQIAGLPFTENSTGMSGSRVLMFPDMVLKAGKINALSQGTVEIMRWLEGRLPVPRILAYETAGDQEYLLMTRVQGKMACDREYLDAPDRLLPLLAEAIRMLWQVDISRCPRSRSLNEELAHARKSLEAGIVDFSRCEKDTFGPGGLVSGFIDLGDSGVADKWRDLALCFRSLRHNTDGTYGHVVPGLRAEKLFDHLGIAPDWDKLRYYILLDEFF